MVVTRAPTPRQLERSFELRRRVFCGEQNVDPDAEFDGLDAEALHVVASEGGEVLGTCRVVLDGGEARLGRMAVERSARRRGIGSALLAEAERCALESGAARVVLHAQAGAERFYGLAGYSAFGPRFLEQGIEHVAMEKALA